MIGLEQRNLLKQVRREKYVHEIENAAAELIPTYWVTAWLLQTEVCMGWGKTYSLFHRYLDCKKSEHLISTSLNFVCSHKIALIFGRNSKEYVVYWT